MLLNFLKIAVRNLTRQKSLAFINIFGLSLGIACFILLLLYSLNELSFDRFHSNERNIFAMYELRSGTDGNDQYDVAMALPMAPTFKKDFPDVEFSKSIMIGNTLSDMEFGRNLGVALTIFLPTTRPDVPIPNPLIDLVFPDLQSVARTISL